jgi:transposase
MRTIRRVSLRLNGKKWAALVELARRYAAEKDDHLVSLSPDAVFAFLRSPRDWRDGLVAAGYTSPHGLQARQWKAALQEAYATIDRQWAAVATTLRDPLRGRTDWTPEQKHYAFWLLKDPGRLAALCGGRAPEPEHFRVDGPERKAVRNYLRRVIRRQRGHAPRVRKARSFVLDVNMYRVFEHRGRQYIAVMGLRRGQRIVIPLTGYTILRGTVRIVLDFEEGRIEVHIPMEIQRPAPLEGEACGLDAGVTEVFTDEQGQRYGLGFGRTLSAQSDTVSDQGRKRAKLRAITEKAKKKGNHAKARRIHKYNLGKKKQKKKRRKMQREVERQINTAIHQVLQERQPCEIVTERLDIRGKAKSKKLSRLVAQWARGTLKERTEFKASAGGSGRKQVNPAYSSQTCPVCGYVHRDNRQGDRFQCLNCGHVDDADRVAAHNLKARRADPEIHLWTPKEEVKAILLRRFTACLERTEGNRGPTVSGRTPGTLGFS